jgi:hypothetical protein
MSKRGGGILGENGKVYWHDAFFEALQLELYQYKDYLEFENEHQLSKEALRMDVLVIKKDKSVRINKNIGKIFRSYNIFEYKSEADSFSRWDYSKVFGYAFLYSAFEQVPITDITVSILLAKYPRELIKYLKKERKLTVQDVGGGICQIIGDIFPVQILESKKLPQAENIFLRNLRSGLSAKDMHATLQSFGKQKPPDDKNAYLDRLINANLEAFKETMNMGIVKDTFLEVATENGWLDDRLDTRADARAVEIAKKFLLLGDSVDKVSEGTGLPIEVVEELAEES